jgi:signal transduction histidine kinase
MDETHITKPLLKAVSMASVGAGLAAVVTTWLAGRPELGMLLLPVILIGVVAYRLTIQGRGRVAAQLLTAGLCIAALTQSLVGAGPISAAWLALPVAIMFSAWTLGPRTSIAIFILGLGTIGVEFALHAAGHAFPPPIPFAFVLNVATVGVVALAIGLTAATGFEQRYAEVSALSEQLQRANLELEQRVALRTKELEATVVSLKQTQDSLIQAEKLASLGALVAGISHELNTPIGNAVTVASSLTENIEQLEAAFAKGEMKRSELARGLGALAEGIKLIDRSVNRAASLVTSFKQVAIDQTSERRRTFDLKHLVDDVLATLKPGFKHRALEMENQIPAGIECDSFPGPLGQILTNLVQNAALHAFDDRDRGQITVAARCTNNRIDITVSDDGIGMDTATLLRIFDPFFTTKLGKGGSGLGLSVSNRIAATILAGELRATSTPGAGSQFILSIPQKTPGKL